MLRYELDEVTKAMGHKVEAGTVADVVEGLLRRIKKERGAVREVTIGWVRVGIGDEKRTTLTFPETMGDQEVIA